MTDGFDHIALVSLESQSGQAMTMFRKFLRELDQVTEILAVSSIYQVRGKKDKEGRKNKTSISDLSFCVIIKLGVSCEPNELLGQILMARDKVIENEGQGDFHSQILTFDDRVDMSPSLTLPHPDLHRLPQYLVPAIDICPDYVHGVLNQSLGELGRKMSMTAEFYAQGKTLLDFANIES